MPEFGETDKGFKMKGWSPFTKDTEYIGSKQDTTSTQKPVAKLAHIQRKKGKKKSIKIPVKSPSDIVSNLQKKLNDGSINDKELKMLRSLQDKMETGPGSYGNEEWDKE